MNTSLQDIMAWALNSGNGWVWVIIAGISLLVSFILKIILKFIATVLKKPTEQTASRWDGVALNLIGELKFITLFIWIFQFTTDFIQPKVKSTIYEYIDIAVILVTVFQFIIWGRYILRCWNEITLQRKIKDDPSSAAALGLMYVAVQAFVIVIIILMGMSELGINIGALVAGLGIGGIAVALAAQNVLGDLLASLSIVLDKPFVVGDFVVSGDESGTVEHIGIKTTRVRSLAGEEIIFANKDLLESRVHNYKTMWKRRVVQTFGITYSTSQEILDQIPSWVKTIVENHDRLEFDRCHLAKFGASSLEFEFVFIVDSSDYNVFMDLQQSVLVDIFKKFAKEKIDFAFPTQSLYIEKLPKIEDGRKL